MKKTFMQCLLLNFLCLSADSLQGNKQANAAVSYTLSGGRLGDNLVAYAHAKWISYKFNIPLLYKSFAYSDQLALHKKYETFYDKKTVKEFRHIHRLPNSTTKNKTIENFDIRTDDKALYIVHYFPESKEDRRKYNSLYFDVNWEDKQFIEQLRADIKPLNQAKLIPLPQNMHTLAVHVRKGSGRDRVSKQNNSTIRAHPLKFPTDDFYIEQMIRMSEMLNDEPIYAYLFTDSSSPKELTEDYKKKVNKPNVTFACCKNLPSVGSILDDFFSMMQFDYLIRADSNYSLMAENLGNFKIAISPLKYKWDKDRLKITEVLTCQKK